LQIAPALNLYKNFTAKWFNLQVNILIILQDNILLLLHCQQANPAKKAVAECIRSSPDLI